MSGFMGVNGPPDGAPMRAAPPISDLVAGLYAAFGTVCALHARGNKAAGGGGQAVEASLTNGLISMLAYLSAEYLATGTVPARTGNDHPIVAPYGLFHAADGEVAIAPSNDQFVRRLLATLGLEALLDQPDFATNDQRMVNRDRLNGLINQVIGGQSVEQWIDRLNQAGVPCGRVMDMAEVFDDDQVVAQDMVLAVDHPGHGTVRMTGFPVKLSADPCTVRRPAPDLGAHTDEVLAELGYDPAKIAALRADDVI